MYHRGCELKDNRMSAFAPINHVHNCSDDDEMLRGVRVNGEGYETADENSMRAEITSEAENAKWEHMFFELVVYKSENGHW